MPKLRARLWLLIVLGFAVGQWGAYVQRHIVQKPTASLCMMFNCGRS